MIRFWLAMTMVTAGCAHASLGRPVQQVVDEYGVPAKVIDMPGGRRLFQWWWSDMLVEEETEYDRSPEWWTANRLRAGGSPLPRNCSTDVVARWDEGKAGWIVETRRGPTRTCGLRRP